MAEVECFSGGSLKMDAVFARKMEDKVTKIEGALEKL
jgi:hypothetical protein